jgi:polyvinyl alcohol dehydrogenase (cytochrome)
MYGRGLGRTFSTDCASAIDPTSVARLAPAWFVDTARPVTAAPAVVDDVVYVGSWEATMYALESATGDVIWKHLSPPAPGATYGPIVSSAAVADVEFTSGTRRLVIFGSGPRLYALDAKDGTEVWVHDASNGKADTPTEYESSPVVWGDLVLVGRDTHNEGVEETAGVRGGLVALDVRTGAVRWVFEPEQAGPGEGCGGMWSSPTLDTALGLVFMGTANCPVDGKDAWGPHINAVTALDVATGAPRWSFQPSGPPDDDTDFGATPNLFTDKNGRKVLGAGKKDGTYYALDPATGAELWSTHVVDPAPNIGGFIGSPAAYQGNVFGGTAIGSPPFFHSFDGATGDVRFQGGVGPTYGATAVVNGVAFNAALDDLLKAYDTETGRLLWSTPLTGPGSSGPAIYEDMVFIGSGTSTSDACAKDQPYDDACVFFFDTALATLGGIHAYKLVGPGGSSPGTPGEPDATPRGPASEVGAGSQSTLPATGGTSREVALLLAVAALGARALSRPRSGREAAAR